MEDGTTVGPCVAHARKCGAGIGVLLSVSKCQVILLSGDIDNLFGESYYGRIIISARSILSAIIMNRRSPLPHLHFVLPTDKEHGCFYSPPFVDAYGETDEGLRRGNPLFFCQVLLQPDLFAGILIYRISLHFFVFLTFFLRSLRSGFIHATRRFVAKS